MKKSIKKLVSLCLTSLFFIMISFNGTAKAMTVNTNYEPQNDPIVDTIPPKVISVFPVNNAALVKRDLEVCITFDEGIKSDEVKYSFIDNYKNSVLCDTRIENDKLYITPKAKVNPLTTYIVKVESGCIQDLAGNKYLTSIQTKFKTEEATCPVVIKSVPTQQGQGAKVNSSITLTFNTKFELMDSSKITLKDSGENIVPIKKVDTGKDKKTLVITPKNALDYYKVYTLTVSKDAVKSTVTNEIMENDYQLSFKTAKKEAKAPVITTPCSVNVFKNDTSCTLKFSVKEDSTIKALSVKREIVDPQTKETSYENFEITKLGAKNKNFTDYTSTVNIPENNNKFIIEVTDEWDNTAVKKVTVTKKDDTAAPVIKLINPAKSSIKMSNILTNYNLKFAVSDALSGVNKVLMTIDVDGTEKVKDEELYMLKDGDPVLNAVTIEKNIDGLGEIGVNNKITITINAFDRNDKTSTKVITIQKAADTKKATVKLITPKKSITTTKQDKIDLDFITSDESGIKSVIINDAEVWNNQGEFNQSIEIKHQVTLEMNKNIITIKVIDGAGNEYICKLTITRE